MSVQLLQDSDPITSSIDYRCTTAGTHHTYLLNMKVKIIYQLLYVFGIFKLLSRVLTVKYVEYDGLNCISITLTYLAYLNYSIECLQHVPSLSFALDLFADSELLVSASLQIFHQFIYSNLKHA